MAYCMFAASPVNYADKDRGMQSVLLHGLEAFAGVTLSREKGGGVWTVPPFFIDSVAQLAGFVMNVRTGYHGHGPSARFLPCCVGNRATVVMNKQSARYVTEVKDGAVALGGSNESPSYPPVVPEQQ